jgi:hypothetical protein
VNGRTHAAHIPRRQGNQNIPLRYLIQANHSNQNVAHDPMKHNSIKLLSILAALAGTVSAVRAQTEYFTYADGNLILGFQATSGQGSAQNVFLNLGKATDIRDNGNKGVLGNIGATLTATYGAGWYAREDLWFGVIANLNHQPFTGIGSRTPVDGDPSRTFYISRPASAPGAALLIPAATYAPDLLGIAGNSLRGLEQVLTPTNDGTGWNLSSSNAAERGIFKEEDGSGILSLAIPQHATAWNNSWSKWNSFVQGGQAAAFQTLTGGIQQNFGKSGSATYVDIQRVLATNSGAVPAGVVGGGTYETTISISSAGVVMALAPAAPKPIPPFVDTDNDGLSDFLEELLVDYGFDKNMAQPELVAQFIAGQGFFTATSIQDLVTANQVMIQADGAEVNLALPVFKSTDLDEFIPAGNMTLTIPKTEEKEFYRIELGQ